MEFSKLKVGTRLGLGFTLVLTTLCIIVGISLSSMATMRQETSDITDVNNIEVKLVNDLGDTVMNRMILLRNMALLNDAALMKAEQDAIQAESVKYANLHAELARYLQRPQTQPETRTAFARLKEGESATLPIIEKAIALGLANKADEATKVIMDELRPQQQKWMAAINELLDIEEKLNKQAAHEAEATYHRARVLCIAFGLLALLTGAAASIMITRGLIKRLGGEPDYASEVAARIAAGDLTTPVEVKANDRTSMMYAMKEMRDSLAAIVGQVRAGTETIASASSQVAAGSQDLSSRTEKQASSLEETASSMEELTSTVKQNAENAQQANVLAGVASGVAQKGGEVIAQVVGTMDEINSSASQIADIIGVIDGIAFQTNILALNAAVEAARAGEQGRGFAVVASEVRNLAQRSAGAAKEIKALINDSTEKVENGSKLVHDAGSTMQEIVESVKRVTDIMEEITAASQEQTTGIEQINQAIAQMDEVTQQNAALVEQAAAASEAMQDQAGKLAQAVSVFKLDGAQLRSALVATVRAPATKSQPATRSIASPSKARPMADRQSRQSTPKRLLATAGGSSDEWEEF